LFHPTAQFFRGLETSIDVLRQRISLAPARERATRGPLERGDAHRTVSVYKLLIIDEIGYLPLARTGQSVLQGGRQALREGRDDPDLET
jgi:hypothetical protein